MLRQDRSDTGSFRLPAAGACCSPAAGGDGACQREDAEGWPANAATIMAIGSKARRTLENMLCILNPKLQIPNPNGLPNPKSQTNFQISSPTGQELDWELVWDLEVGSA